MQGSILYQAYYKNIKCKYTLNGLTIFTLWTIDIFIVLLVFFLAYFCSKLCNQMTCNEIQGSILFQAYYKNIKCKYTLNGLTIFTLWTIDIFIVILIIFLAYFCSKLRNQMTCNEIQGSILFQAYYKNIKCKYTLNGLTTFSLLYLYLSWFISAPCCVIGLLVMKYMGLSYIRPISETLKASISLTDYRHFHCSTCIFPGIFLLQAV